MSTANGNGNPPGGDELKTCPEAPISHLQEFIDNLPYIAMILIGAAIFWVSFDAGVWRWLTTGLYVVYGVVGALWIMLFVCPYCHFYDTRLCPCGYGQIASKLRAKRDGDQFARQFRRHIPFIVPLWFIPADRREHPAVRALLLVAAGSAAIVRGGFVRASAAAVEEVRLRELSAEGRLPLDGNLPHGRRVVESRGAPAASGN